MNSRIPRFYATIRLKVGSIPQTESKERQVH